MAIGKYQDLKYVILLACPVADPGGAIGAMAPPGPDQPPEIVSRYKRAVCSQWSRWSQWSPEP